VSESAAARAHRVRPAPALRNVYACLVHESQECVIDLVRNLRCLDPESSVLLYNGGPDPKLLQPLSCFDKLGAFVHPDSRAVDTDTLHEFALACMRYALVHVPFDTLTIVDSDQLGLRAGWSSVVAQQLAGKTRVGRPRTPAENDAGHARHRRLAGAAALAPAAHALCAWRGAVPALGGLARHGVHGGGRARPHDLVR
jgi:hypothetical protein